MLESDHGVWPHVKRQCRKLQQGHFSWLEDRKETRPGLTQNGLPTMWIAYSCRNCIIKGYDWLNLSAGYRATGSLAALVILSVDMIDLTWLERQRRM